MKQLKVRFSASFCYSVPGQLDRIYTFSKSLEWLNGLSY